MVQMAFSPYLPRCRNLPIFFVLTLFLSAREMLTRPFGLL
jgi:hypothetical protein